MARKETVTRTKDADQITTTRSGMSTAISKITVAIAHPPIIVVHKTVNGMTTGALPAEMKGAGDTGNPLDKATPASRAMIMAAMKMKTRAELHAGKTPAPSRRTKVIVSKMRALADASNPPVAAAEAAMMNTTAAFKTKRKAAIVANAVPMIANAMNRAVLKMKAAIIVNRAGNPNGAVRTRMNTDTTSAPAIARKTGVKIAIKTKIIIAAGKAPLFMAIRIAKNAAVSKMNPLRRIIPSHAGLVTGKPALTGE